MSDLATPIDHLATFLTGSRVALHSVGLQMRGTMRSEAEAFFALRNAFGVSGYMTRDEAVNAICAALESRP